jgi:hypothetical protein
MHELMRVQRPDLKIKAKTCRTIESNLRLSLDADVLTDLRSNKLPVHSLILLRNYKDNP